MRCKPPDSRTYEALRSLNAGFLDLVTSPDAPGVAPRLGLDPPICAQLSRLAPEELEFIAVTSSDFLSCTHSSGCLIYGHQNLAIYNL